MVRHASCMQLSKVRHSASRTRPDALRRLARRLPKDQSLRAGGVFFLFAPPIATGPHPSLC